VVWGMDGVIDRGEREGRGEGGEGRGERRVESGEGQGIVFGA